MRRKKYTIEEVKEIAIQKNGECLSDVYMNNKTDMIWRCNLCLHIWYTNFKAIHIQNNWCPNCSGRLNITIAVAKELAKTKGGKCLSEIYINNKTNMIWKCKKGHIWEARLDRIREGTWCPKCRISRGERFISTYLDRKGIRYICQFIVNEIGNKRFDFFLPDSKIWIEFDGVQHFQIYGRYSPNIESLKKIQKYDLEKTLFAIKKGIKLIRIDYENIGNIEILLDSALTIKDRLIFTSTKYEYITDTFDQSIQFIFLLTDVGQLKQLA